MRGLLGDAWTCLREGYVLGFEWGVKASFYRQREGGFPYTTRSRISIDGDIFLIRNRSPYLDW